MPASAPRVRGMQITAGSPGDAGSIGRCSRTERSREGGRHLLEQGDALQIFPGNLVAAEMRDPPGRLANNVRKCWWSVRFKFQNKGKRVACLAKRSFQLNTGKAGLCLQIQLDVERKGSACKLKWLKKPKKL